MKRRYYLFLTVGSYLLFLLSSTPAAKVLPLIQDNFSVAGKFYGLQGSLWNGSMQRLQLPSQNIDQLQWSVNPLSLLLASISADVDAVINKQHVSGQLSAGLGGQLSAKNVRSKISAIDMQDILSLPFGELAGLFDLHIESVQWSEQGLDDTLARIDWSKAQLTLADTVDLGHVAVVANSNNDHGLDIKITNTGGMLSINGDISINANKVFTLDLDFVADKSSSANINQSLAMFAKKQTNGHYQFKQSGNLSQFGF